jgi:hypothetical protein
VASRLLSLGCLIDCRRLPNPAHDGPTLSRGHFDQALNVADGRHAEKTAVFPAELGGALVADFECGFGSIQASRQHEPSRFVQPHSFLELHRTHGRRGSEVVVEGRGAQAHFVRQLLDSQWSIEIGCRSIRTC